MLGSRLHSKSSSLVWQIAVPRSLILHIILYFINGANGADPQVQNILIPITTPQIIYTPFVCNATVDSQLCSGAWHLSSSKDSIFTTGPTAASGSFLPQLFADFREVSRLTMNAIPSSNATVNITLSGGGIQISNLFDSSLGTVTVVNLPQDQTTHLTVTFVPSAGPTVFGLESFVITVPQNASISSLLPTPPLPTFSSLPTSASNSSSTSLPTGPKPISKQTRIAEGVGITIALIVVLALIGVFLYQRGKKRKERNEKIEKARSGWQADAPQTTLLNRVSGIIQ